VWTVHDAAVAAGCRVDAQRWGVLYDDLMLTAGARVRRPEPRRRVRDFVRGLLAPSPRNNCWTIAEHAGDTGPDGMQDLLTRVKWDDAASGLTSASSSPVSSARPMACWSSTRRVT
jgi:hypothetical protein